MCIASTPKVERAPQTPKQETVDTSGNAAANRDAENRRKRYAMKQQDTTAGGDMTAAAANNNVKKKLGE